MDSLALPPNNDPSVALAAQVKQYGTVTFQAKSNQTETVSLQLVVVGFDKELFFRKCHPSSKAYDPNIDFNLVANELFKKDETWAARDGVLEEAVNELAKYHGFATKKVLLQSMPSQNGEWRQNLDEFASQRESYARYCLNNIPGNRGIQGSSASESNHSSVLSHLNKGNRFGNQYCATPIVLIRDLLRRQKVHNQEFNSRLLENLRS